MTILCSLQKLNFDVFKDLTSTNGIMSLTICLCAFLLLVSSSSAEIFNKSWWNNTVLYQIYLRSFYDSNGDGIGDLKGITSKLPYIADTGINVISLSSIYLSPNVNLGYDISNFTEIDLIFGTIDDFKTLAAKAHKLGLKVILDFVPNHTSDQHPWFQKTLQGDKKYKEYYMWAEGKEKDKTPPNNWISKDGDSAWTYVKSLKQWYLHQYGCGLPDLNYSNPDVIEETENTLKFWLDRGVDGFSVISAPYIFEDKELQNEPRSYALGATPRDYSYLNHIYTVNLKPTYELLRRFKIPMDQYADEFNEDEKVLIINEYTDFAHTIEYYKYDTLPLNFLVIKNVNDNTTGGYVKEGVDLWINSMPSGKVVNWMLGNDNNPRVASRFPGRLDQLTMTSMILPGMAVTYYGDEIGMVNEDISSKDIQVLEARKACKAHYAVHNSERTPFQWNAKENAGFSTANSTWLPVNSNYKELNLEKEMNSNESHYKIYKTLAYMHRNEPALTKGSYTSFTTDDGAVFGVIRKYSTRFVVLLIDRDDISREVDLSNHDLPARMKLKVASLGSRSSLKKRVDINNIYLPKAAAVVYTSLNIH